ncbi:ecdysteroid 22-kinase family protein [Shewanella sp. Isolate11]|nr:oxidoreductase family protein [Shewanella sp. Isolate11]MCG9696656.1 ecdysteroid 22-kinase family protein [Shewanella sp. Isolate11]
MITRLQATKAIKIETIQSLWSGYGEIARYKLITDGKEEQVIVKNIQPPSQVEHPYQWNNEHSHQRKMHSYHVEATWYKNWAHLCSVETPLPNYLASKFDEATGQSIMVLSDLNVQGFPHRREQLSLDECKAVISWLAHFHGQFITKDPQSNWCDDLWPMGCYWHLATRTDEFEAMPDNELKHQAAAIDTLLNQCQFQTLVHGDAKVANFCFSDDFKNRGVAAVDFQYVGAGVGVKDLIYLLGSCLSVDECETHYDILTEFYFQQLISAVKTKLTKDDTLSLVTQWRQLLVFAWADFERFLQGWAPKHHKRNRFSETMTNQALAELKSNNNLD